MLPTTTGDPGVAGVKGGGTGSNSVGSVTGFGSNLACALHREEDEPGLTQNSRLGEKSEYGFKSVQNKQPGHLLSGHVASPVAGDTHEQRLCARAVEPAAKISGMRGAS